MSSVNSITQGLEFLLKKNNVSVQDWSIENNFLIIKGAKIPLLAWRINRKNATIKKIVKGTTGISKIDVYSFAQSFNSLNDIIIQELDLACWWANGLPDYVMGFGAGESTANIILKLDTGAVITLQTAITLPDNAMAQSKHEINTFEGIVCDRTVDTMIGQAGVYYFSSDGKQEQFYDPDFYMYGLNMDDIDKVYSAFLILSGKVDAQQNINRYNILKRIMDYIDIALSKGCKIEINDKEYWHETH